jgi:hypothetical protein
MLPNNLSKCAKSCCLFAALAALPTTALADHRGGGYYDRGDRYRNYDHGRSGGASVGITFGAASPAIVDCDPAPPRLVEERVYVEPVYRTVVDRKWVEPVYRTVTDRVGVPPVVQTIPDHKWIPDRYEWRDVVTYDHYGRRRISREYVLVEPAHFIDAPRTVEIAPGRWDDCTPRQELVSAGHWEDCPRQELVSGGYWTTRTVAIAEPTPRPVPYESSHASISLRFPIGH